MMTVRCPVDADCAPMELAKMPQHLYEVHTENTPGVDRWEVVERCLAQATVTTTGESGKPVPQVRNDCAFCHRERSHKDDNHAPECPYWDFFGRG